MQTSQEEEWEEEEEKEGGVREGGRGGGGGSTRARSGKRSKLPYSGWFLLVAIQPKTSPLSTENLECGQFVMRVDLQCYLSKIK